MIIYKSKQSGVLYMSIKIKGVTRYLLLSLGVPIITFFLWYNISLVPELNKANSIIEYNTKNINKLKNDSNNLFNDSYSNKEFNQDLNTFKIIYNSYLNYPYIPLESFQTSA